MLVEKRMIGGSPSIALLPSPEEAKLIDRMLGDCGQGPIALLGYLKMTDGYGPCYISIWNPDLNKSAEVPKE